MDKIYTTEDAAEILGTTPRLLAEYYKTGELKAYKVGKRVYLLHSELVEFLRKHPYPKK